MFVHFNGSAYNFIAQLIEIFLRDLHEVKLDTSNSEKMRIKRLQIVSFRVAVRKKLCEIYVKSM